MRYVSLFLQSSLEYLKNVFNEFYLIHENNNKSIKKLNKLIPE